MYRWFCVLCAVTSVSCLLYFLVTCESVTTIVTTHGSNSSTIPFTSTAWQQQQGERSSKFGYAMAGHFSDQMTGSVANLLSLQCWAGTLGSGVRVVEPFLRHSLLGVNLDVDGTLDRDDDNSVRLYDVMDHQEWEDYVGERNFSSIISWESFIKDAPRKLILVFFRARNLEWSRIIFTRFYLSARKLAKKYGFEVVRNASLPHKHYQTEQFREAVYGEYSPPEVVVFFHMWGGVVKRGNNSFRVSMPGSNMQRCIRDKLFVNMPLSRSIVEDGARYARKYIGNSGYISVMVRLQYLIIKHQLQHSSMEEVNSVTALCFKNLLGEIATLKSTHSVSSVFLTMDCRSSGAVEFSETDGYPVYKSIATTAMDRLFPMLFGNSTTLEEWDRSFEDMASHNAPGYIAMLQKHLAAKGTCLLTVGGGMFQQKARQLHSTYHPNSSKCAYQVPMC